MLCVLDCDPIPPPSQMLPPTPKVSIKVTKEGCRKSYIFQECYSVPVIFNVWVNHRVQLLFLLKQNPGFAFVFRRKKEGGGGKARSFQYLKSYIYYLTVWRPPKLH